MPWSTEGEFLQKRDLIYKNKNYLHAVFLNCKSPWHATAFTPNLIQEHLRLTLLPAVNLTFLLAIRHLIKVWFCSHSRQSVQCKDSRTESSVLTQCVDVHFEQLLVISVSLCLLINRHNRIWVGVQKEVKSCLFACFCWFLVELCDIERIAKLALKYRWLKLVTKSYVLEPLYFLS